MGRQLTHEEYLEKFKTLKNNEDYEIQSEYKNSRTKIKYYHKKCKNVFYMKPNNFNNGQRCPYCFGYKQFTTEQVKKEISEITNNEYILKSEYINTNTKMTLYHTICKNNYLVSRNSFINGGYRCPYCAGNKKLSYNEIAKKIKKIDKEYKFLNSEKNKKRFKNVHSKIKFKHLTCGKVFKMTYNNFRNGQRCPYCARKRVNSKAVNNIIKFFDENNISYETEVTIENLINPLTNKHLRFDFYLPLYDLYIEYDGKQHFKYERKGYFTETKFHEIQDRDKIKNDFVKRNNIKLLRIPYYKNEITVIKEYFKENSKTSTTIETN